jgi:hypothetical protein
MVGVERRREEGERGRRERKEERKEVILQNNFISNITFFVFH